MPIMKLEHVGIMARDVDDSIRFYTEVLEMVVFHEVIEESSNLRLAFLGYPDSKETVVELIGGEPHGDHETGIVDHLAFTVDDIHAEVERLRQHNVEFIHSEVQHLPGGVKYIFFVGPNREHLELFESPIQPSPR